MSEQLTQTTILEAAVNVSSETFKLGDREFPLLDLAYDDYIQFVAYCAPVVDLIVEGIKTSANPITLPGSVKLPTDKLNVLTLVHTLGGTLPKMVQIMCKQSDPTVTEAEVKRLGKTPMAMCQVLMAQIKKNNMVNDFSSFFGQVAAALTTKK